MLERIKELNNLFGRQEIQKKRRDKIFKQCDFELHLASHVQDIKDIKGRQYGGGLMTKANYKMEDKTVMQMRYVRCLQRASY